MSDINLKFINSSNDQNNSEVVFFQKNVATDFDEIAVAWTVIENCATGWYHDFTFPMEMDISASDSWGNEISTPKPAENGQMFEVFYDASGNQLKLNGSGTSTSEVQLRNALATGSIDARIYKSGKLLATKTGVSPSQKAVFQFLPTLWVGVVSQVEEGEVMNSAIISEVNTELSLLGIASASIVMKGGGTGKDATPFTFTLEDIVRA